MRNNFRVSTWVLIIIVTLVLGSYIGWTIYKLITDYNISTLIQFVIAMVVLLIVAIGLVLNKKEEKKEE